MMKPKKILTHTFVTIVNFYFLTFFFGLLMMAFTIFIGSLNPVYVLLLIIILFILCIFYEVFRNKFKFFTIGESIINNRDKNDILNQIKIVRISRIPIFILILITLIIIGNMFDGLSTGHVYNPIALIIFSLLIACVYTGIKKYFIKHELLPVILIIAGLMLVAVIYKVSPNARLTGGIMFNVLLLLSILWLITGIIYKKMIINNLDDKPF